MDTKGFMFLTTQAKYDNSKLLELLQRLKPLINSYSKKLFFLDKDDATQEIILAIIEAVKIIPVCKNDNTCFTYIWNAVKYKHAYLCKKNLKITSFEEKYADESLFENVSSQDNYIDIVTFIDLERHIKKLPPKKQLLFKYIIQGYSDKEIANIMGCSRQYINRIKKTKFRVN